MADLELAGRVALVTGVSRPIGIAAAVARRLHEAGATVFATGWSPHDEEMPWGASEAPELGMPIMSHDLEDPSTPTRLVDEVVSAHGRLDIAVAVHARSSSTAMADVTATDLDRAWAINVRSVVLLARRLAEVHQPAAPEDPPLGRMLWFTSGQHFGPMDDEIDYAITKGALHQMTASIDHALSSSRIVANCINPGPVDTGYAHGDVHDHVASLFPDGRWGVPDHVADLVEFLVSDRGAWMRGQVLNSEGGFNRYA